VLAEKERLQRQKESILLRRRAAVALAAEEPAPVESPNVVVQRPLIDTGPIAELARSGVRTLRSVRRRPPVTEAV
jgi:hypothetical protein